MNAYSKDWLLYNDIAQTFSVKKVFKEFSQNSQENTCARVSILITMQASGCWPHIKAKLKTNMHSVPLKTRNVIKI